MSHRHNNSAPARGHVRAGRSFNAEKLIRELTTQNVRNTTDYYIGRILFGYQQLAEELALVNGSHPITYQDSLVVPLMQRHGTIARYERSQKCLPRLAGTLPSAQNDLVLSVKGTSIRQRKRNDFVVSLVVNQNTESDKLHQECSWLARYNNQAYSLGPCEETRLRIAECNSVEVAELVAKSLGSHATIGSDVILLPATICSTPKQ